MAWWKRWTGGRIWVAKDGKQTFYGEVGGRMVSTHRDNETDALAELIRLNIGAGSGPLPPSMSSSSSRTWRTAVSGGSAARASTRRGAT